MQRYLTSIIFDIRLNEPVQILQKARSLFIWSVLLLLSSATQASTFLDIYSISTGPVIDGNTVYFGDGQGFIYALEAISGKQYWRLNAGGKTDKLEVSAGLVYFQTWVEGDEAQQQFYAVQKATGKPVWQVNISHLAYGPFIRGSTVFAINFDGVVSIVSAATGATLRQYPLTLKGWKDLLLLDETLFLIDKDGQLIAVDADNGKELWRLDIHGHSLARSHKSGELLFLACKIHDICAVHLKEQRLERIYPLVAEAAHDRWMISGDFIYYATGKANLDYAAEIHAVSISTAEQQWKHAVPGTNWIGNLQIENGRLFFDRDKMPAVSALVAATGKPCWQFEAKRDNWPRYFQDDVLYITDYNGVLYAVDVQTGRAIWQYRSESLIASGSPVSANGNLYFGTQDGRLIVIDSKTGRQHWQFKSKAWKLFKRKTRRISGGAASLQIAGSK